MRLLRILHLEDSPLDAELILATLEEAGIESSVVRVETRDDFLSAIEPLCPDLILADYSLPSFDGISALEMAREGCPDVPFIFVSGALGEEMAIKMLKSGATDYVLKHRLDRLVPSVRRALREADERAERRQAEQRLRESEDRYRLFVENAVDYSIFLMNTEGVVTSWNSGAERIQGYSEEEIIGRHFSIFHLPEDRAGGLWKRELEVAARDGSFKVEHWNVRKDGSRFWASVVLTALKGADGSLQGYCKVIRDHTERKIEEAERERLVKELEKLYGEAREANRLKDDFLATVSHELRTPLNAMLGWLRLLRTGRIEPAEADRALETIERNAKSQAQLIEDLLDVSRIITGKISLNVLRVDPAAVVEAALDAIRPVAEARGIALHFSPPPSRGGLGTVMGDPDRLQQVVSNLLSNSVKFTPSGGRIEAGLERRDRQILIRVKDTGQGMSPEFLPYAFDRFRQADGSTTRAHGGLGLGLAIVSHLVEKHNGTVQAESEGPGKGATFTVTLPLIEEPGDEANLAALSNGDKWAEPEMARALRGLGVLVVDDEEDARAIISLMLQQLGARVRLASSAADAMREIGQGEIDLIISDIAMPGEDGYSLISRVKALEAERGWKIPAIALTAYAREEDRLRALEAGYVMHIPKPIEPEALASIVASVASRLKGD
ncbi:MAG TPA: response regulator [Blastocatellia bacterium]|nr:response regulator [Blastocatellia bacterium]